MKKFILTYFLMFLSCHIAYADEAFSENQKNQIEKIIHSYLLKKPEILVESAKELKKKIDMEQNQFQVIDAIDQKKNNIRYRKCSNNWKSKC